MALVRPLVRNNNCSVRSRNRIGVFACDDSLPQCLAAVSVVPEEQISGVKSKFSDASCLWWLPRLVATAEGDRLSITLLRVVNRPPHVRFRANRTLSRHRRMTECDPKPTQAGLKSRSAAVSCRTEGVLSFLPEAGKAWDRETARVHHDEQYAARLD